MRSAVAVFQKELRSYFNSPIAYIVIILFVGFADWLFFRSFFMAGSASMRLYFTMLPWLFMVFAPLITMRLWAEEKKLNTLELLMTMPLRDWEAVLGKFFSSLFLLVAMLVLSLPLAFCVSSLGNMDWGPVIGGYLGAFLMGAAYLSIGLFVSCLTQNQIVAAIVSFFICFGMWIVGEAIVVFMAPASLAGILEFIGLGSHFDSIGRGVIDSRDIIYYLTVIGFFLFLNIKGVESRKWA